MPKLMKSKKPNISFLKWTQLRNGSKYSASYQTAYGIILESLNSDIPKLTPSAIRYGHIDRLYLQKSSAFKNNL